MKGKKKLKYEKARKKYQKEIDEIRKELERKVYDFYTLFEISRELSGTLNPEEIIKVMLFTCMAHLKIIDVTLMVLMLPDNYLEEGETTKFVPAQLKTSSYIKEVKDFKIEMNSPLVSALLEHKHILKKEDLKMVDLKIDYDLCVPLLVKEDLRGIMFIGGREAKSESYSSGELEFLSVLASFTSLALENARLYTMAITDGLTHLYTHRCFQLRLNDEFKRAKRYQRVFSLIIFDIDNFKNINDKYGHAAGDMVLIEITKLLKKSLRNSDIASRQGGDEFSVILPETNKERTIEVAERIRKSVAEKPFDYNGEKIDVTLSIGVSSLDTAMADKKQLFEKADSCLYQSKESGRNKVTF